MNTFLLNHDLEETPPKLSPLAPGIEVDWTKLDDSISED